MRGMMNWAALLALITGCREKRHALAAEMTLAGMVAIVRSSPP
jgi:hypothetical protein